MLGNEYYTVWWSLETKTIQLRDKSPVIPLKLILRVYKVPGSTIGAGDTTVNKTGGLLLSWRSCPNEGAQETDKYITWDVEEWEVLQYKQGRVLWQVGHDGG